MWTASAEPDHISTAPTTATPLTLRRRTNERSFHYIPIRRTLSENRDFGVLTNRATIVGDLEMLGSEEALIDAGF